MSVDGDSKRSDASLTVVIDPALDEHGWFDDRATREFMRKFPWIDDLASSRKGEDTPSSGAMEFVEEFGCEVPVASIRLVTPPPSEIVLEE